MIEAGVRPESDMPMVDEAEGCAANMERWRKENYGKWRTAKPAEPVTDEGFEKLVREFDIATESAIVPDLSIAEREERREQKRAARTRVLTAHAAAIKAAEARIRELAAEIFDGSHHPECSESACHDDCPFNDPAAAIRAASKIGEA